MLSRDAEKPEPASRPSEPAAAPPRLLKMPRPAVHPGGTPTPPPAITAGPDARSLLRAVRRRWLLASSAGVLAAVVVGVTLLIVLPQQFIGFATIQITANPVKIGMPTFSSMNDLNIIMKTQAARFKSRDVLMKSVNNDKVRTLQLIKRHPTIQGAITWLEDSLKVDVQDNNELMSITLPGDDADELVVMVDALTGAYLAIVNNKEFGQRKDRVKKVQGFVDGIKEKLADRIATRQALLKGQRAPDSAAMIQKQASLLGQFADAQRTLALAQFEADKVRAKMAVFKGMRKVPTADEIPDAALTPMLESDSLIKPRLMQLANIEKLVVRLVLAGHTDSDPSLRETRRQLAIMQKELEGTRANLRVQVLERYVKKLDGEFKMGVEALQAELLPYEANAKKVEERVEGLTREIEAMNFTSAKLDLLNKDILGYEQQLAGAEKQLQVFQMEEEAEPRIAGCQDAVWQVKDAKKRLLVLLALPLLACGGAATLIGWLEFRARRIHSADEVAVGLGMRVVGAVPALAHADRRRLFAPGDINADYDHELVESIDGIRTMLLRNAAVESTQVVMVSSAVSGEGKTTLASNLAISLARAGRKTLLLDCDLRRPALHQLFEQTLQPGFSEVLLGEVELPDAVRPTTTDENLFLLPAGQWDREVLQELARDGIAAVFERLKQEFDFVIVDSHPVLPATDSLLIGQHADAVIVSVLRELSQAPRVYAAQQRLATLGIRVIGAVVNGMPAEAYDTGYHYEYTAEAAAA